MKKRNKGSNALALYLSNFGRYICLVFVGLFTRIGQGLLRFFKFIFNKTDNLRKNIAVKIKYLLVLLASPFLKVVHAFQRAKEDINEKKEEYGSRAATKSAVSHITDFIFGKNGIIVNVFNIAAPIVSIVFFFNIVSYASALDYVVKLTVNGKVVGYIENEQVFYDADQILKERINYLGSDENIKLEPEYSLELSADKNLLTEYQVADKILEYSDISVQYAYGFFLNGVFMGAMLDNSDVSNTLDGILQRYRDMYPDAEVSFKDKLEYDTAGLYLSGSVIDTDWLISQLTSVKTSAGYYIVEDGDSHSLICDKLGLTMAQIELLNPGFEEMTLYTGDKLKIREEVPFLSVNVTVVENYDVSVPYETEYYDDNSLYVGVTRVTTEGVDGVNNYTAKVTYVNNIETERKIISTKVVSRPVTEKIARGIKPTPESYSPDDAGYGKYIWPVDGGYLSELTHWDGGYAGHVGVDIAAPYGTAIWAGASGTVVTAKNDYYSYGKYIVIDHGNGYQTLYAHCSALYVSVGDKVTQGQMIAAMGETGLAYGVHLHFEVRQGRTKYNPLKYLEKTYYWNDVYG